MVVYQVYWSGPSVYLTNEGSSTLVDLTFLGEYCIGVERIRIENASTHAGEIRF